MKINRLLRWLLLAEGAVLLLSIAWRLQTAPAGRHHFGSRRAEWVRWRPATDVERKAVIASIQAQLDAFRKDDYVRASEYQSEMLRRNFVSVEMFRRMMKSRYPQFAHYRSVSFGPARADHDGDRVRIVVHLTGSDGTPVQAIYTMVLEGARYRVAAVVGGNPQAPPPGISA